MIYADYKFYSEVYGGKAVSAEDFPRLAAKASALIDKLTILKKFPKPASENSASSVSAGSSGKFSCDDEELIFRLKMCCCELCEGLSLTDGNGGMVKQSESVGSWSCTLAGAENASEGALARAACRAWLPAEWLYRGVYKE